MGALTAEEKALRDQLAQPILAAIRERAETTKGPPRVAAMLRVIADHLFDPALNVNWLKDACSIRDNSMAIHFHAAEGRPPHRFILQARIDVAKRLLTQTPLPIWRVSELLGFSSIQVFSCAFQRVVGTRPSRFRQGQRGARRDLFERLRRAPEAVGHRAFDGRLSSTEAAALIRHLLEIYPPRGSDPVSPPVA